MDIHKDIDLFRYAAHAQRILQSQGIRFYKDGFPDLTTFDYPIATPRDLEVWPYSKRNQASNPRKTVLTFFEADTSLYGYINTLDKVAANLSMYYAATGFDLSPCLDFSIKEQKAAILLNSLTNGLLMSCGIHVIPSFRIGCAETVMSLKSYPRGICYAYGALGCGQRFRNIGRLITELKIAFSEPSQILAYGRLSAHDREIFEKWNVPIVSAIDYQAYTRQRTTQRRNR